MSNQQNVLVTPFFKVIAEKDERASREAGRPIFKNAEYVEVRIAGDRNYAPCFPAHSMWSRQDGVELTYADRWPDQYARFKANQEQVAEGTPLSELPFLDEAKRAELRALKIYSAEALAGLEGKSLKSLGMMGNELKQKAKAYLESATGSANVIKMAQTIAALQEQIKALQAANMPTIVAVEDEDEQPASDFDTWDDELLKEHIAEKAGARPKGNPSHSTLVAMAGELSKG